MTQRQKLVILYPIVVEGKYDRARLESVCQAQILTTDGFGLFKKSEKLALIQKLAQKTPIIILTDSDGAGKVIRSHLRSAIPDNRQIQLYIPKIKGVEKRKSAPSAEGTLGVEGMEADLLYDLLSPFENKDISSRLQENPLSKTDLYIDGLTGGADSQSARDALCKKIGLPDNMTSNALLCALRILVTYDEYLELVQRK